jgi:hypothetical protein
MYIHLNASRRILSSTLLAPEFLFSSHRFCGNIHNNEVSGRRVEPMSKRIIVFIWTALALGFLLPVAGSEALAQANLVSKEELKGMLGRPDVVVIDVRQPGDLEKSTVKIKGALREDPRQDVKSWADKYPKDKTIVLYCA